MRHSLAGLLAVVSLAGCAGASVGRPVLATAPTAPPAASVQNGACVTAQRPQPSRAHGLVTVGAHPVGGTAVWRPGLNQRPCKAALSRLTAPTARRLAADVRAAPKFPSGTFSCPSDDGAAVDLYLAYAAGKVELVTVSVTGCPSVQAPGRAARATTPALLRDLATVAPAHWSDRLRSSG